MQYPCWGIALSTRLSPKLRSTTRSNFSYAGPHPSGGVSHTSHEAGLGGLQRGALGGLWCLPHSVDTPGEMGLKSITVSNFKCFNEPTTVEFDDKVAHGPELTAWLLEHEPDQLREVAVLLEAACADRRAREGLVAVRAQ